MTARTITHPAASQDCIACEGHCTGDSVRLHPWTLVPNSYRSYRQRLIEFRCPHCGHRESRVERDYFGVHS